MVASDEFDIDVLELTISQLQEGYAQRRFTAETVARAHLARIERYEPTYNAFTSFNPAAIEDAKAIDARRAKGDWLGPLAGVPIVVKETVDVFGLPTTMGWAPLSSSAGGVDLMPERDAPVVARLRAAGAVILGKTNVPAFCWDGGAPTPAGTARRSTPSTARSRRAAVQPEPRRPLLRASLLLG